MKSREILPEECRNRAGNNYGRTYVKLIFKALEAAEEELEDYKQALFNRNSDNDILQQKGSKLQQSADERYNKAFQIIESLINPENDWCVSASDAFNIKEALKIAAYGSSE